MPKSAKIPSVKLKVGEIPSNYPSDVGIGIVRMSHKSMSELDIAEGDSVEICGNKKTGAVVVGPYPGDSNLELIRMDVYTRRNADTSICDWITAKKLKVVGAKKIVLAPAERGVVLNIDGNYIKSNMVGKLCVQGDTIVPLTRKASASFSFNEFFRLNKGKPLGDDFHRIWETWFEVVETEPKGIVEITKSTKIQLLPQSVEDADNPEVIERELGDRIVNVKKVPVLKNMTELSGVADLIKIGAHYMINKYEDSKQIIYFVEPWYFKITKNRGV